MKSKIQISIPTPCHENWQNMTVADKGRFCASCRKNVIDFTKSSDREILKAFKNDGSLCGRFNDSQLNRDLFVPKEKNTVWIAAASGVFAFFGIGNHDVKAQEKIPVVQTSTNITSKSFIPTITIKGVVTDTANMPLPGVEITSKERENSGITTQSDFDGFFTFKVSKGETLIFKGYGTTQELVIKDDLEYKIQLKEEQSDIDTINTGYRTTKNNSLFSPTPSRDYTVGSVTTIENFSGQLRNRTFFGRIFHSIGNLFRPK
jgi:hypothetical protein